MSRNSKIPVWIYIVLLALLGLNVYQWINSNQLKESNELKEAELYELEKISTGLESDVEAAMSSLEELRSDNQAANELIDSQKLELQNQKKKISGLIWKSRELKKAKEEIENLNASVSGYIAQISQLKGENQKLAVANTTLRKEKEVLTTDLNTQKEAYSVLDEEKKVIAQEKAELDKKKALLDEQVDVASAIKLNSLIVEGRQNKGEGESKEQKKVKKLDFLRTCIITETNVTIPPGKQEIYVRIIDPQGTTVAPNDGSTGGILVNKISGEELRYTFKGFFDYTNNDHQECFDWDPDFTLSKGQYEVQAFHRDYMVGKGSFLLK
jgi:hypothetical protein